MTDMQAKTSDLAIKIAILDDEVQVIEKVSKFIKRTLSDEKLGFELKEYTSVNELKWDIEDKKVFFDIYILDIEIGKDNGMEVARYIRSFDETAYLVFLTSYMEYSIEGYECDAYRYILKSQMEEKLGKTISTLCRKAALRNQKAYIIDIQNSLEKIYEHDIYYLYKESKYTYFVLKDNITRVRKALGEVVLELSDNLFVPIDKSCVVNIEHVMRIHNQEVIMRNEDRLKCSRTQLAVLKEKIKSAWGQML